VAERSPDETDADIDAERPIDDDVEELPGTRSERSERDPDETDVDIDAEREVDETGDDLYEEQPDLGDFEGNLNA
jgi:hypothetical protein